MILGVYVDQYDVSALTANVVGITDEYGMLVLLADQNSGIIGDRDEGVEFYDFMRFICLPMDQIDDLDLVGIEYASTEMESDEMEDEARHNQRLNEGRFSEGPFSEKYKPDPDELVLPDDDPRRFNRYDADRFFARFSKYGVTRTLPIPDTSGLHWNNKEWGTKIFIFPLDQSNE